MRLPDENTHWFVKPDDPGWQVSLLKRHVSKQEADTLAAKFNKWWQEEGEHIDRI
jgi:hypothetical protein